MAQYRVKDIAAQVNGQVIGDGEKIVVGVNDLEHADSDQLSFLGNSKYIKIAKETAAGVVLVGTKVKEDFSFTQIRVEDPSRAFSIAAALFAPPPVSWPKTVHPTAVIAADAVIGKDVYVGPYAVIEAASVIGAGCHIGAGCVIGHDVKVGDNCFLYPRVTVGERCVLGKRVMLHSGVVIGSDGFGYEFVKDHYEKIPQTGYVQIDDDVEIGANTTVDRGRFGRTWIQQGVKIDNLVMIAHNVVIGKHTVIVAQTGLAGSVHCGAYVTIAGQVGTVGHIRIGDKATITGKVGVSKDCEPGQIYSGHRARPVREVMKIEALTQRLPELFDRVKELEERGENGSA